MKHNHKILHVPSSGTTAHCQHTWVCHIDDTCVGHIQMQVEADNTIKFLDAWVHDKFRRQGIYRSLWDIRWKYVQEEYLGYKVYAWCKQSSLPLLIEKGFKQGDVCTYVEKLVIKNDTPYEQCFVSC